METGVLWAGRKAVLARFFAGLLLGIASSSVAVASGPEEDLSAFSMEQLMDLVVTSVSKKPQLQSSAAAAIHVVTAEQIHRSGATSLPDVLRLVPGVQVARIDANKWAVTARGFNGRFANKLLVLIDGRSVYTPLFAGVYWEAQQVVLGDIDRIEVIRGPGGTLWGANAVNGVINIITRSAADTHGGMLSVAGGDELRNESVFRYGSRLGNGMDYRVYAKSVSSDTGFNPAGAHDDSELRQAGFRADWQTDNKGRMTLQGDIYDGEIGQQITTPVPVTAAAGAPGAATTIVEDVDIGGGNLLFRWQQQTGDETDFTLQIYYDHVDRDGSTLFEDRDILDIDLQGHWMPWPAHQLVWGLGYRRTSDDTRSNELFSMTPPDRKVNLFSAFLQDEFSLLDDRLALTFGSKFEHNDFTGTEVQPNVRMRWMPDVRQTWWGAISRAVRTPARGEQDVRLRVVPPPPLPGTAVVALLGTDAYKSESLLAYELGYRIRHEEKWNMDVALFYNQYDNLRTFDAASPPPVVMLPFANRMQGTTYGIEFSGQLQATRSTRLQMAYSYLNLDLKPNPTSAGAQKLGEDASPHHQASLTVSHDLQADVMFDSTLRYVGGIRVQGMPVDAYTELDLRLAWQPKSNLELSLVGRNLLDSRHVEFVPTFLATQATEVERSAYLKVRWTF